MNLKQEEIFELGRTYLGFAVMWVLMQFGGLR